MKVIIEVIFNLFVVIFSFRELVDLYEFIFIHDIVLLVLRNFTNFNAILAYNSFKPIQKVLRGLSFLEVKIHCFIGRFIQILLIIYVILVLFGVLLNRIILFLFHQGFINIL